MQPNLLRFGSFRCKRAVRQAVKVLGSLRRTDQQVMRRQTQHLHHLHHLIKLHTHSHCHYTHDAQQWVWHSNMTNPRLKMSHERTDQARHFGAPVQAHCLAPATLKLWPDGIIQIRLQLLLLLTDTHHIRMSHKRRCFICFVVLPTTEIWLQIKNNFHND